MRKMAKFATVAGLAAVIAVGVPGTANAQGDQAQILSMHNQYRAEVGNPSVQWDDSLAADAQAYADQLLATNDSSLPHSATDLGENLGFRSSSDASSLNATDVVASWYAEKQDYVEGEPGGGAAGHYTQMVSKRVQRIGCGQAIGPNPADGMTELYVVCRYDPQGNDGRPPYGPGA